MKHIDRYILSERAKLPREAAKIILENPELLGKKQKKKNPFNRRFGTKFYSGAQQHMNLSKVFLAATMMIRKRTMMTRKRMMMALIPLVFLVATKKMMMMSSSSSRAARAKL
jgi:hypothetical protein